MTTRENIDSALTAAESDGASQERLRVVLSDEAAAARYREVLDDSPDQFKTSDLDRALAAGEREREEREAAARRAVALETATAAAQAAAARSNIELRDAHVRVIYETGETHESGLSAVERTTAALAAAADQQLPTETIIRTWKANKSAPGGIAAALVTKTRVSRLERLFSAPRAAEAFIVALDEQDPSSRTPTHPTHIDRALDIAEREFGREAEQQIPGASSATGRRAGVDVTEAADTDHHVQQVIAWLRTEVDERQQFAALRARTRSPARLNQRNRNAVTAVVEKSPRERKLARRVPDATWEDAEPLMRALTDMDAPPRRRRLDQRARHAVTAIDEKTPRVAKPARRVPEATREDAVAAAPLIVRARLPEAEQQELHLGVDIVARELAGKFEHYQWWSHTGGELHELHWREDRYRETKEGPEIGMLRTVLERDVYEKAFPLIEHPVAEPDPPPNLVELVRPFIRWLQDAVDRLINRVLDREPAHPQRRPAAAAEVAAEPVHREASPPPPEPTALNVTEAERVRVAVDAVEVNLPRTRPYPGNPSYRPPAVSDERLDHLAAATDDKFVKTVVTKLQTRQAYYTDFARSESEETYLRPTITRKHKENRVAYEKADAARGFFSRRLPKPTWAEAQSVVIKKFEAEQLRSIEAICRGIQQLPPAAVRREFQRLEKPEQVRTFPSRSSSHTKQQDRGDTSPSR